MATNDTRNLEYKLFRMCYKVVENLAKAYFPITTLSIQSIHHSHYTRHVLCCTRSSWDLYPYSFVRSFIFVLLFSSSNRPYYDCYYYYYCYHHRCCSRARNSIFICISSGYYPLCCRTAANDMPQTHTYRYIWYVPLHPASSYVCFSLFFLSFPFSIFILRSTCPACVCDSVVRYALSCLLRFGVDSRVLLHRERESSVCTRTSQRQVVSLTFFRQWLTHSCIVHFRRSQSLRCVCVSVVVVVVGRRKTKR